MKNYDNSNNEKWGAIVVITYIILNILAVFGYLGLLGSMILMITNAILMYYFIGNMLVNK